MAFVDWDEQLSLGDPMIDREHQTFVALINKVHEVSLSPDRDAEIMRALTAMYLYAKEHFFDEEALMERVGYADRLRHAELHRAFVTKTHALTDACLDGSLEFTELMAFLVDWLKQHIQEEDARIVRHAQDQEAAKN
ncbi:MAG: bacteriohemerythrin [Humidesulfovibrio sp.]|uniref:bacteriohemerythrin n=1 Tax=Humidesulfovibrio sp. TaxID=2910988 RepID=UPI002734911C|nr:bacteriohemerythrin [Humidesulfovibrio sp.]MDP2849051.1 bacteriohemerythrin [Humidesulfovibrio sp.]